MRIVFFIIVLLMILLPDTYIEYEVIANCSWWLKGLFLLPTVIYIFVSVRVFIVMNTRQSTLNAFFWLTLCLLFPVLIFTVISLIGKEAGAPVVFNYIGLGAAVLWMCMALYGCFAGWKKVVVNKVEIPFAGLPEAFDGYRIVHLSDIHIGTYNLSPGIVDRLVDTVNSLEPDLIVFTGDLVNVSPEEIDIYSAKLAQLSAPDGVLSVLGNHDYCNYRRYTEPDSAARAFGRVIEKERQMGWRLLRNEAVRIGRDGSDIAVLGVDNAGSKPFPDKSNLSKALQGLPPGEFKILLSHDPSHWRREVLGATDIALTLSGHTHGMQFKIGGFSPSKWSYKEWGGLYEESSQKLFVSTGVGGNVAFRFGVYPEVVLITLRQKEH